MPVWRWREAASEPVSDELAQYLTRMPSPALLGRLLVTRGVRDAESARRFLEPSLANDLASPTEVDGLDAAIALLLGVGSGFTVVAEASAAGLLAGVALVDGAARLGLTPGLRLDPAAAGVALELDGGRRIACGRTSAAPGDAVVARRPPENGAPAELSVAGVALYLLVALRAAVRSVGERGPDLRPVLDLVGLATLLEGVALHGENRLLARRGVHALAGAGARPGLRAMLDTAMAWPPTASRLVGRLGPRLDAAARSMEATWLVELLTTVDAAGAARSASEIEMLAAGAQRSTASEVLPTPIEVDAEISVSALTPAVLGLLDLLEPHGAGNPDVVLLARAARIDGVRLRGGPDRPQCLLRVRQDGRTIRAVAASAVGGRAIVGDYYDVVFRARRGDGRAEIEVLSLGPPSPPTRPEVVDSIAESVVS